MQEPFTVSEQEEADVLATFVVLPRPANWNQDGQCEAWMEQAERQCGRERMAGSWLCKRHDTTARRRMAARIAKEARQREQARAEADARRPRLIAQLRQVEARIATLDPEPPTRDLAALGSAPMQRYRSRYSDARIHELAELHSRRVQLRSSIGADHLAAAGL